MFTTQELELIWTKLSVASSRMEAQAAACRLHGLDRNAASIAKGIRDVNDLADKVAAAIESS